MWYGAQIDASPKIDRASCCNRARSVFKLAFRDRLYRCSACSGQVRAGDDDTCSTAARPLSAEQREGRGTHSFCRVTFFLISTRRCLKNLPCLNPKATSRRGCGPRKDLPEFPQSTRARGMTKWQGLPRQSAPNPTLAKTSIEREIPMSRGLLSEERLA